MDGWVNGLVGECVGRWTNGWKSREMQRKYNFRYTLGLLSHLANVVSQFNDL